VGGGIRSRGGKGEEEEHGAEPEVPTPDDGNEGDEVPVQSLHVQ